MPQAAVNLAGMDVTSSSAEGVELGKQPVGPAGGREAAGTRSRGWEVAPGEPAPGVGHSLNPLPRLLDGVVMSVLPLPGDTASGNFVASLL